MNQKSDTSVGGDAVLVTGATGDIGRDVVRELIEAGVTVRALCRRDEQRSGLADLGAEPVIGSFDDAVSLRRALAGCDRMFLLTPPVPAQIDMERTAIDLAHELGLRHVVRVSAADSNLGTGVPWAQAHAAADHYIAKSGVPYTVLRPSAFMQNFSQQASTVKKGFLPQTTGKGTVSWIDTADVAAVAARILTQDGHNGATYFLTGPEPLSIPQVAAKFGQTLGKRVRYVQLPSLVYALVLRLAGQSWFTAWGLREQFAGVVRHQYDLDTTYEVERLIGRPPRSFDQWVKANIEQFR